MCLCHCSAPVIIPALYRSLQLGSMILSALFFLKIDLAVLGLSCFLANLQLLVLVL